MPPNPQLETGPLRWFTRVALIGLVLLLAGCKGYYRDSNARTAGEVTDDRGIHTAVKSRLITHGETRGWKINVDVFRGTVTLRGYVKSEAERSTALELARGVKGVKQIDDKLVVLPPAQT